MAMNVPMPSNKGFTLIELAIVLVIVGLLVGVGSSMVGVLTSAIKVRESKDLLDAAVQSVVSFASSNNRIPDAAGFPGGTATPQDAWGRDLIYLYDANLYAAAPTKDTICGRRSTALTIHSNDTGATITNVAFAVVSKSSDASVQTTATDGAITTSRAAVGTVTIDANNSDIVRWVTLDELRSKVGCQGGPLKIVNNELPFIPSSTLAGSNFVTIAADGGVPMAGAGNYNWCVEFAARTGISLFDTVPTGGIKGAGTCWSATETGNFVQGTTLALRKKAALGNFSSGSYHVTVFVRDAAGNDTTACNSATGDNCVQKPFVLTVNPN